MKTVDFEEIGGRVKNKREDRLPKAVRRDEYSWKNSTCHKARRDQRRFANEVAE